MEQNLEAAVAALANLPDVACVMLAGSRATGTSDETSDYDLYVYSDRDIAADARRVWLAPCCGAMEWDNRFWEPGDEGELADGVPVDIMYRRFDGFEDSLARVVETCEASVGYTTCFWASLLASRILFDRAGRGAALKARFSVAYPAALQRAIVAKNLPLIAGIRSSYLHQIEKALRRADAVSVSHRVAALLASWFDVVFAVHAAPHPGEKRLLAHLAALPDVPHDAARDIVALLAAAGSCDAALPALVQRLDERLRGWLDGHGLLPG
jgi:predicted nucleotidyltransferase